MHTLKSLPAVEDIDLVFILTGFNTSTPVFKSEKTNTFLFKKKLYYAPRIMG